MALACDLRIVSEDAILGLPEARLGLLPGAGGTQRMAALCGAPVAKRLILGAETVRGSNAVALGLAQWSAPAAQLGGFAQDKVATLAALPAAALAACKHCIDLASPPQPAGYLKELAETRRLYGSEPTRTLVQQFISKRKS
jgi:enoyl-CoA hydratase/carnithine racemase